LFFFFFRLVVRCHTLSHTLARTAHAHSLDKHARAPPDGRETKHKRERLAVASAAAEGEKTNPLQKIKQKHMASSAAATAISISQDGYERVYQAVAEGKAE
jgi:hypothetical protein